ncbi:MAG: xanthomonadin transporter, partial [Rhodanobacter sp.]
MHRGGRAALLLLWLLALAGLGWMVSQRLKVSTDLRSFMPAPTTADQRLLMEQVGEGPGSRLLLVTISGGGKSDAQLAALSQGLLKALHGDHRYSQLINGGFDLGALDPKLLPYRYLLSPTLDTQPLDETFLSDQLQQRLDDLSSPAASMLKNLLPRDPTLEMLKLAERWAPAKSPEIREGVWFSPQNEALLLVQTAAAGFDPDAQQQSIDGIQQAFHALPESAGATLEFSGPGYFSMVVAA